MSLRRSSDRLTALCLLFAAFSVLFQAVPAMAEAPGMAFPQALTDKGPVEAKVLARTVMKKVRHSRVLESLDLSAQAAKAGPGAGERFVLTGDKGEAPAISRYNRVLADYLDLDPENPALMGLALFFEKPDGGAVAFVSDPLASVERPTLAQVLRVPDAVDVARAQWREKDYLYLINRLLDRPFDEDWRYSMDGPSTFLQRRFDKDLMDVGAVDVVLRRNQKVQVNLVAGFDPDRPRSRTVLDWYKLPKRVFELENGRSLLRIYIGRYLRENFPGAKSVTLRELSFMFFKENQSEVLASRNVERLAFAPTGLPPEVMENGLPHSLPADADIVFTGRKQLSINVSALSKPEYAGFVLKRAVLNAPPLDASSPDASSLDAARPYGARLESARLALVSPRDETPAYLAATDDLCATFDGPRDLEAAGPAEGGGGAWAAGQRPLWSADFPFAAAGVHRAFGAGPQRVAVFGAETLFHADAPVRYAESGDGLGLSGRAGAVEMRIPGEFEINPGETYSFWLELGRTAPDMTGATLMADGYEAALKPNAATRLDGLPGRLTNIRVRFTFAGPEFSLNIRRAVFSAAAKDARESVFAAPFLMPWKTAPESLPDGAVVPDADWLSFTPVKKSRGAAAIYLPGIRNAGESLESLYAEILGKGGARELVKDVELSGSRLVNWARVFGESPTAKLGAAVLSPAGLDPAKAAVMASENAWIDLGRAQFGDGDRVKFADNPWFEARALLVETGESMSPLDLSEPPKASGGKGGRSMGLALGLGVLALAAAFFIGRRLPWRKLAGPAASFLAADAVSGASARRQAFLWLGLAAFFLAAGLALGFTLGRASFVLAGLALVPVWRGVQAAPPDFARRLPEGLRSWFAATPGRRYFAGFVLAAVFAALLRSVKLAPVSECVFTTGLYLLFIGLFLESEWRARQGADRKDA